MKTQELEPLKKQIATRAGVVEHNYLLKRFNVFSGVENIQNFKQVYLPKLESWEQKIEELLESNEEVRECIVKFDQDMSMKCNKSALVAFKHELDVDYIPIGEKQVLEGKIQKTLDYNLDLEARLLTKLVNYNKRLDGLVATTVDDIVQEKMNRYDAVAKNFERFFNYNELEAQFAEKANVSDLAALHENKADRWDLESLHQGLVDFNEKLKHVSVFLTEVATNFP